MKDDDGFKTRQAAWRESHLAWQTTSLPSQPLGQTEEIELLKRLDLELSQTLLPDDGHLYFSETDNRFRAYLIVDGARPNFSASVALHGEHRAFAVCWQWLWHTHEENPTNSRCHISGLLDMTF